MLFLNYSLNSFTGQKTLRNSALHFSLHSTYIKHIIIFLTQLHQRVPMSRSAQGFTSPSTCFRLHPKGMKASSCSASWREKLILIDLYSQGILYNNLLIALFSQTSSTCLHRLPSNRKCSGVGFENVWQTSAVLSLFEKFSDFKFSPKVQAHFLPAGFSRPLTFTVDKANNRHLFCLCANLSACCRSISEPQSPATASTHIHASNAPRITQTIYYLFALVLQSHQKLASFRRSEEFQIFLHCLVFLKTYSSFQGRETYKTHRWSWKL